MDELGNKSLKIVGIVIYILAVLIIFSLSLHITNAYFAYGAIFFSGIFSLAGLLTSLVFPHVSVGRVIFVNLIILIVVISLGSIISYLSRDPLKPFFKNGMVENFNFFMLYGSISLIIGVWLGRGLLIGYRRVLRP